MGGRARHVVSCVASFLFTSSPSCAIKKSLARFFTLYFNMENRLIQFLLTILLNKYMPICVIVYKNNTSDFAFLQKNVYERIQILIEKTSRGVKGLIEEDNGVQVAR